MTDETEHGDYDDGPVWLSSEVQRLIDDRGLEHESPNQTLKRTLTEDDSPLDELRRELERLRREVEELQGMAQ